ncbi:sugar kinase [Clavibacter michiganensis]|nr:sugar kinase [Clavibacter michiganensis]
MLANPLVVAVGASWAAPRTHIAAGDTTSLARHALGLLARVHAARTAASVPVPAVATILDDVSDIPSRRAPSTPTVSIRSARARSGAVVTLGETLLLLHPPGLGTLGHTAQLEVGVGGAESNVAIALTRLGRDAAWIGVVGADGGGDRVVRALRGEGIDVLVRRDTDAPTAVMIKERPTAGTVRVTYHRAGSAGSRLTPEDVPLDRIRTAACLHVTGITPALSATASAAVDHAVAVAAAASVPVSFDVNHRRSLWRGRDPGPVYRGLASAAYFVFAGEDEARLLVGDAADPLALAHRLADLGPRHSVVKLGARGCVAVVDGVEHVWPAIPVQAVDTVGAGDGFVAGYLAEALAGLAVAECLDTAVAVGAFQCTTAGDWEGLPRRVDLALLDVADPVIR